MNKGKDFKPHIGIFGRRNKGKSSFINTLTGQDVAIVSELAGTTTDPVKKSYEIFGIGPVILVDTAGTDDEGEVGLMRVKKSLDMLALMDCAVLLIADNEWGQAERDLLAAFGKWEVPYLIVHNKSDLCPLNDETRRFIREESGQDVIPFSSVGEYKQDALIEALIKAIPETAYTQQSIFDGLIKAKDLVVLVTPVDSEAPEGRMILPQVMAIRHALDQHCICVVLRETELDDFITNTSIRPALVVTDSQAFAFVSKIIPADIPLTGFSVLFARMKGHFDRFVDGTPALDRLRDGDRVLIMESCSHRVSCEDIGRYKLPDWILKHSGRKLEFEIVSGIDEAALPVQQYAIVIQCGGCVFTRKQVMNRLRPAIEAGVPVSNYGMAIAWMHGIFQRAVESLKPKQDEKLPFISFK